MILNNETSFTTCLYCGNNIALTNKEINKLNIKKIIPFEIEKDEAINKFNKIIKKEIVDAKKIYVPIRFCNYEFNFYMCYKYLDDDRPSRDLEELIEGQVENEIVFSNSKIKSIYLPYELRNKERLAFDPVLLKDVSIEYSIYDNIDNLKKNIEKDIALYFDNMMKYNSHTYLYTTNYFISNIEMEPFSTLIPVYILKTKTGEIYSVPGVHPNNFLKKDKKVKDRAIFSITLIILIGILFLLLSSSVVEYTISLILIFMFVLVVFISPFVVLIYMRNKDNDNIIGKTYDNFKCKRHVFDKKNKKFK